MDFKIITYNTDNYRKMVDLRYRILREPLGLNFTENDLDADKTDFLLAAFRANSNQLVACCILSPLSDKTVQLRQMAVEKHLHKQGVGSELLLFAEKIASEKGFDYIYLHARKIAVDFYKKHGYSIEGNEFTEVGIPHFEMIKQL